MFSIIRSIFIDDCVIHEDGRWYGPFGLSGHPRTSATPEDCRERCLNIEECYYFNNFPNRGCHVAGVDAKIDRTHTTNPTIASGKVRDCESGNLF